MAAPTLRRDLTLLDAVGVGLGAIVGGGIFVVSGLAAKITGPGLLLSLVLAAVVAACNALSSAQLAARFPTSGGTYEYGYELLHPLAGFAAGWTFLASKLAAGGTVALGFGHYLAALVPGIQPAAAGLAALAILTIANLAGIKKAGKLNLAIVAVTLTTLILFVLTGLPQVDPTNLTPLLPKDPTAILQAAALIFFAFTGYARIATLAEEVKDPTRTIPRAIVIALATATLLYLAVAYVALGLVGAPAMAATPSPLIDAAKTIQSLPVAQILGLGAVTAMLGVVLSQILGISRVMLAMARRQDLPAPLAHLQPKTAIPDRAVLLTSAIIALVTLFGTLEWIVAAATFTILLYYTITNLAALRLPKEHRFLPPAVAWSGLAGCLALAFSLKPQTILYGLALLFLGLLFRTILHRADPDQKAS